MRIAVLEAVCAGLCGADPPPSLLAEGRAMWRALIEDLLAIPDVTVETVVDDRWFAKTPASPRVHAWRVTDITETMKCWDSCLEDTDAAWIIAPECDGMLEKLVAAAPGSHYLFNATPEAIRLCADKFALAQHLEEHHIATIPTECETWIQPPVFEREAWVIKPRDGAGSQGLRIIEDLPNWETMRDDERAQGHGEAIRQPYLRGEPLSIAGWFHAGGVEWFPVAD
jgi:tyramine---L-glutamate ligase